jgi:hypothetical protein
MDNINWIELWEDFDKWIEKHCTPEWEDQQIKIQQLVDAKVLIP